MIESKMISEKVAEYVNDAECLQRDRADVSESASGNSYSVSLHVFGIKNKSFAETVATELNNRLAVCSRFALNFAKDVINDAEAKSVVAEAIPSSQIDVQA